MPRPNGFITSMRLFKPDVIYCMTLKYPYEFPTKLSFLETMLTGVEIEITQHEVSCDLTDDEYKEF